MFREDRGRAFVQLPKKLGGWVEPSTRVTLFTCLRKKKNPLQKLEL